MTATQPSSAALPPHSAFTHRGLLSNDEIGRAKSASIENVIHNRGIKMRRSGAELVGPCPVCGDGDDRFSINPRKQKWYCRRCDKGGGDAIGLVEFLDGVGFREAVTSLNGGRSSNGADKPQRPNREPPPVASEPAFYIYELANGAPYLGVKRTAQKDFYQHHRVGSEWASGAPDGPKIPYRLPQLLQAEHETVLVAEGEKDADNLAALGFTATTNSGGAKNWSPDLNRYFEGKDVYILPDNDEAGVDHCAQVVENLFTVAREIHIVNLPGLGHKGDASDWISAGGTADQLVELMRSAPMAEEPSAKPKQRTNGNGAHVHDDWPDPKPLVEALLPVAAFQGEFVPASLGPWIEDISDRLQCPPDYVAVAAITALGAVIGRRIGIKPQLKTDWIEFPNVWGCFIGRPGALKSPAMGEALKPIHRLEAEAAKDNQVAQEAYAAGIDEFKLRKQVFASLTKDAMKNKKTTDIDVKFDLGEEPKAPVAIRYRTNDSSYESLGELLIGNPTGILVERDELVSLLQHLDRDEQCVAKGFYLSGWGGSQPYTFDRIGRGHRHVDAVCLSVLGNTQPARIAEYVRQSNKGGAGGDGLLQRFSLLVWPDAPPTWRDVDQYPLTTARESAWEVFTRLSKLDTSAALKDGAELGAYDKTPALRFADDAHATFLEWRSDLEPRVRHGELSASLEGHLAKYRKLVPSLALLNHLADAGTGFVALSSLKRAIGFAEYLETHARRLYGSGSEIETAAAKAILRHIRRGDLSDGFTARDAHRPKWTGLTDIAHVELGLTLLVDLDYLAASSGLPGDRGGRPTTTYRINPKGQ